jgi:hypothetical protein
MACNFFDDPWCGPTTRVRIPEGSRREEKMPDHFPTPDPSIREYVLRVKKADEMRGELIGQALIFEAELNAWIDSMEKKEDA